jgi:Relaxase/Mobilisation nuclease domain
VVIKGTACAGAVRIAKHLSCTETNERNEIYELRGVAANGLYGALREMEAVALGSRCTKPFYHASINTPAHEALTDEQCAHAIDRLEAALGLSGQPRVVVIHRKNAREHCHIVWSRIDLESMRVISHSHNYRKHEQVGRDLEREFGHARVQGAHVERDGKERPKRTPSHAEMLQAERTGVSVQTVKATITDIWRRTDSGQAFASALRDAGYVLARGDRRDFVVIDPTGGVHSLARCVEGAKANDIRAHMADLNPLHLPSVAEARRLQRERQGNEPRSSGAGSWSSRNHVPAQRSRAAPNGARSFAKRLPVLLPPARDRSLKPHGGFNHHPIRFGAASAVTRLSTFEPALPARYLPASHDEIRPLRFYAELKHLPPDGRARPSVSSPAAGLALPRAPPPASFAGEPTGSPRSAASQPPADSGDSRSGAPAAFAPDDSGSDNVELAQILSAIADEVSRDCAARCLGIEIQFAARIIAARVTLPRNQIAGALAAICAERQAALAAAQQQAKLELLGRSQAAKALYGKPRRPVHARQAPIMKPATKEPA